MAGIHETGQSGQQTDIIHTPSGEQVIPLSRDAIIARLQEAFAAIENAPGAHSILDTHWSQVVDKFHSIAEVPVLLDRVYKKPGDVAVLDEGCGSSITLFELVEAIERRKRDEGKITAFGITASPDFLRKSLPKEARERTLRTYTGDAAGRHRLELILDGVSYNPQEGYYRQSPGGNTMHFLKADAHDLGQVLPQQKFDLIYSHASYVHFTSPWLAFEKACNALKEGGVLLIDAMPTAEIIGVDGRTLSQEDFRASLQRRNPGYTIYFPFENTRYSPLVVIKNHQDDIRTGLYMGAVTNLLSPLPQHLVPIYSEETINGYVPFSAI